MIGKWQLIKTGLEMILFRTFSSEFEEAWIGFEWDEAEPVGQHLVLNDGRVVEQEDPIEGHGGYVREQNPAQRVRDRGVHADQVELHLVALDTHHPHLQLLLEKKCF